MNRLDVGALAAAVLIASAAAPRPARADLDLIKTYSPIVQPGVLEIETRGFTTVNRPRSNDNAGGVLMELGYGVTNWWEVAPLVAYQQLPNSNFQYSVAALENIIQLTPEGKYFLDAGLYLEYARSASSTVPDEFEAKLLLKKNFNRVLLLANLVVNREIGANAAPGVGFEYSTEATFPLFRNMILNTYSGVQAFGAFGAIGGIFEPFARQTHYAGPVLGGSVKVGALPGALEFEVGYLFGLTSPSARGLPKVILEYEIPF